MTALGRGSSGAKDIVQKERRKATCAPIFEEEVGRMFYVKTKFFCITCYQSITGSSASLSSVMGPGIGSWARKQRPYLWASMDGAVHSPLMIDSSGR